MSLYLRTRINGILSLWGKRLNLYERAAILLISFFLAATGLLDLSVPSKAEIRTFGDERSTAISRFFASMPAKGDSLTILAIAFVVFILIMFWLVNREDNLNNHGAVRFFLSFGMAFSLLFGSSLENEGTLAFLFDGGVQLLKTAMIFIAFLLISYLLLSLLFGYWEFQSLVCRRLTRGSSDGTRRLIALFLHFFEEHVFISSLVVLFIGWMPFLLASYPGFFMGDTGGQISQWFNLSSYTSDYLPLLNSDVLLNQHHPVLHTVIMGSFVRIGMTLFNSANVGYFLYTLIQYAILIASISYAVSCAHYLGAHRVSLIAILSFFVLNPIFPQFAVTGTKDTLFASSVIVMLMNALRIIRNDRLGLRVYFGFFIAAFLAAFLRNGSIAITALIIGLLVFQNKQKRLLLVGLTSIIIFYFGIVNVVFPALSITPTGKREMLSIPIQQVSRCVSEHNKEIPDWLKQRIDTSIDYQAALNRYNPSMADSVKNTFDEKRSEQAFGALISSWSEMVRRYPFTCIEATMANYYGYFYPSKYVTASRFRSRSQECIGRNHNDFFKFHQGDSPVQRICGALITTYSDAIQAIPVLSMVTTSAFYSWWLIILMCYSYFYCSRDMCVVFSVPVFLLLINLVGPANGSLYIRYMFSIMCVLPLLQAIFMSGNVTQRKNR